MCLKVRNNLPQKTLASVTLATRVHDWIKERDSVGTGRQHAGRRRAQGHLIITIIIINDNNDNNDNNNSNNNNV